MMVHTAYLLLGSNQGNKTVQLQQARKEIALHAGAIVRASSVYESEPWGFKAKEWFINQVIAIDTDLTPEELLSATQQIEQGMGRIRSYTGIYESRNIDIDILFFGDLIFQAKNLTIPHPRLQERRFTLLPLYEIAPTLIHPVLQKNIATLLDECGDNSVVKKI